MGMERWWNGTDRGTEVLGVTPVTVTIYQPNKP